MSHQPGGDDQDLPYMGVPPIDHRRSSQIPNRGLSGLPCPTIVSQVQSKTLDKSHAKQKGGREKACIPVKLLDRHVRFGEGLLCGTL